MLDKKVWITLLDHKAVPAVDHLQCVVHANRRKVWDMGNGMYITWNGEWNVFPGMGNGISPWNGEWNVFPGTIKDTEGPAILEISMYGGHFVLFQR